MSHFTFPDLELVHSYAARILNVPLCLRNLLWRKATGKCGLCCRIHLDGATHADVTFGRQRAGKYTGVDVWNQSKNLDGVNRIRFKRPRGAA